MQSPDPLSLNTPRSRRYASSKGAVVAKRPVWLVALRRLWGSWLVPPLFVSLSVGLIFGAYGWSLYQRESKELLSVFESNYALLARSLEVASEHALRDGETADLVKLIGAMEALDDEFEVYIFSPELEVLFSTLIAGEVDPVLVRTASRTFEQQEIQRFTLGVGREQDAVRTATLDIDDELEAVLVLRKSMGVLVEDLARTRSHAWEVALFLALASLLVSMAALQLRVRIPLRALRQRMGAIQDVNDRAALYRLSSSMMGNDMRSLAETFEALMERMNDARGELISLHRQRGELSTRLAERDGRARMAQFASELAHEIGSPLQIIVGRAVQLESRADRPEDVLRNATIVLEACERIQRSVEASLRAAYQQPDDEAIVPIGERVAQLAALVAPADQGVEVVVSPDLLMAEFRVHIDADAFDQILRNLLTNAVEACAQTGGRVFISQESDEQSRWLVIRDEGGGIPDSLHAAVWKPWVTTRESGTGHGFGLPIVDRLCRDFGLSLRFESTLGEGTVVRVGIPLERLVSPMLEELDERS